MKHKLKRLVALILALSMCLSMLSTTAWAADFSGAEEATTETVAEETEETVEKTEGNEAADDAESVPEEGKTENDDIEKEPSTARDEESEETEEALYESEDGMSADPISEEEVLSQEESETVITAAETTALQKKNLIGTTFTFNWTGDNRNSGYSEAGGYIQFYENDSSLYMRYYSCKYEELSRYYLVAEIGDNCFSSSSGSSFAIVISTIINADDSYYYGSYLKAELNDDGSWQIVWTASTGINFVNIDCTATHVHSYSDPVFEWKDDRSSCIATFSCVAEDGEAQVLDCEISSTTNRNVTTFEATVEFEKKIYSNSLHVSSEIIQSGNCGDNLKWALDESGTLTISGTGEMWNYDSISSLPGWHEYKDDINWIVINDGVTSIGNYAFYNCANLTDVIIPDSVTTIGEYAFHYYCEKLLYVYYSGFKNDWTAISIGSYNTSLTCAIIEYNSTGPHSASSFYLTLDGYAVLGCDYLGLLDFEYEATSENADVEAELEAIVWESSDPEIAEVSYSSAIIKGTNATGALSITPHKPGIVTIYGTSSDGRVTSQKVSIEPEMVVDGYTCTVKLDEADAEYLEWFIKNLSFNVSGTELTLEKTCEVAEDGLSAICRLTITDIALDYGLSGTSTIKFTSYGGQTATSSKFSVSNGTLNNEFPPATELDNCVADWNEAYDYYVATVKSALQASLSEVATSEEDRDAAIQKAKKAMMEWDEDSGNKYKYLTSNSDMSSDSDVSETMREAEYEALATYLYDNVIQAATDLELTTISAKDSSAAKLVSKLMSLLSGSSATYTYGNVTVSVSGFSFYNQGYAGLTCTLYGNSTKTDTAVFCSDTSSCEEALNQYLEQLDGLYVSSVEQAAYECINCACKVVLDKNLTSLTTKYLENTLSKYTSELKSLGVGDLMNDLNNCYNYYNYIMKFTGLLESDESPENIYDAMSVITFKDSSIENKIVKKAYKALNDATSALNEAYLEEKYGSDDEESDSVSDKLKAIFTCPVSVSVYSSDGTQIGYAGDDDIWYTEELIYIEESGDAKTIHSYTDDILSFTLTATGYGVLGCCIEEYDSETGATIGRANTYDVELTSGKILEVASSIGDLDGSAASYAITTEGNVITADEYISATDDAVIYVGCDVTGSGTICGTGQYVRGDAAVLYAIPEEGYRFICWCQDEMVVSTDKLYEFTAREDITVSAVFVKYTEDISDGSITLSDDSYEYDGSEKEPDVTVEYAGNVLTEKTDYYVYYSDNIEGGTATVTVIGVGDYTGTLVGTFIIINPVVASGTCGDNLTWVLDIDGTLAISGTGSMTDWSNKSIVPWYDNRSKIQSVVCEEGVTSVGKYAFYEYSNLQNITLADSVESVSDSACMQCYNLKNVSIGKGLKSIGTSSFYNCSGLTDFDISDQNPYFTVEDGVLFNKDQTQLLLCPAGFKGVYSVPDGVASINAYAFACCKKITEISLPSSVTYIGSDAFAYCDAITDIDIAKTHITSIPNYAFISCSSLKRVDIPEGVCLSNKNVSKRAPKR